MTQKRATFQLGRIACINVLPVYHDLNDVWEQAAPFPLQVVPGHPTALNALLAEGALDLSPVSSIEVAHHPGRYLIVDGLSIQSAGPVQSVVLVSKHPIEKLTGKTIGRTTASATSRVLLNVLLSQTVGVKPEFVDMPSELEEPLDHFDAALLIGDAALQYTPPRKSHTYDLGELWYRSTNTPMVFAMWAVRADLDAAGLERARQVAKALWRSRERGTGHMAAIVREAAGQVDLSERAVAAYYRHLRYDLDGRAVTGLKLFYECAVRTGDLKTAPALEFLGR
jgi:chorismate dehydratase